MAKRTKTNRARAKRMPGRRVDERYVAYRERQYAARGVMSLILGLSSALLMVLLVLWCIYHGSVGQIAGAVGVGAFYLAGLGLWAGLKSFGDRCRSYAVSKIGSILCGIVAAGWFLTVCWGLA